MALFEVTFNGEYLDGAAVVFADNKEQAVGLVMAHPKVGRLENPVVNEIEPVSHGVIYIDNGAC